MPWGHWSWLDGDLVPLSVELNCARVLRPSRLCRRLRLVLSRVGQAFQFGSYSRWASAIEALEANWKEQGTLVLTITTYDESDKHFTLVHTHSGHQRRFERNTSIRSPITWARSSEQLFTFRSYECVRVLLDARANVNQQVGKRKAPLWTSLTSRHVFTICYSRMLVLFPHL